MSRNPLKFLSKFGLLFPAAVVMVVWTSLSYSQIAYSDENLTIASRGGVIVKISDIDDILSSAEPGDRSTIVSSPARLEQIIDSRLLALQLVSKGKILGLNEDVNVRRRLSIAVDKALGEIMLDELVKRKSAVNIEVLAKETYVSRKPDFLTSESWTIMHMLIKPDDGEKPDLFAARAMRAFNLAIRPEADFANMVKTESDDASVVQNGGKFVVQRSSEFAPEFTEAVVKLKTHQQFAPLTKTQFGYHIIQLLEKTESKQLSYEEARPQILASLNESFRDRVKAEILSDLRSADPKYVEENIRKLIVRYDPPEQVTPDDSVSPSPASASGAPK